MRLRALWVCDAPQEAAALEEANLELKRCFDRAVGLAHSIARGSAYMSTGRQAGRVVA